MAHEITADVKDFVLEALLEKPVLHSAAKAVGVSPIALQKAMDADDEFAQDVDMAMQIGVGAAEGAAWDRAVEGAKSHVFQNGRQVMVIDEETGDTVPLIEYKYSDRLLELILKARKSEVYGDKAKLEVTGQSVLIAPTTTNLEDFRDLLNKHRDNLQEDSDDDTTTTNDRGSEG